MRYHTVSISRSRDTGIESIANVGPVWYRLVSMRYFTVSTLRSRDTGIESIGYVSIVWYRRDTIQYRYRDHAILVSKVLFMLVSFGLGAIPYGIDIDTSIKSFRLCWYCLVPTVSFAIATRVIMRTSMLFL